MNSINQFLHLNLQYPSYTVPILQSCLSLIISKLLFKGISQWISAVIILYFCPFNPFHYSPLSLSSHYTFLDSFQYISLCLLMMLCYVFWYCWGAIILSSLPSFLELHKVVPLLETCSTYEFLYNHVCVCVYVYLLDLSSMCESKYVAFVFLNLAYFT
jgi:hypothetical protein